MYQLYQLYHSGREGIDTPAHEKELNAGPTTSSLCIDPGYGTRKVGGVSADLLPAALPTFLLRCCAFDEVAGLTAQDSGELVECRKVYAGRSVRAQPVDCHEMHIGPASQLTLTHLLAEFLRDTKVRYHRSLLR